MHRIVALALAAASLATADLPKFDQVSNGFKEVVSTADGSRPLYRIWKKDNDLLAELPRGWERQQHIIAATQNRGTIFAGLQGPEVLVYWKRIGDRLMVMTPELGTRSNGEQESKDSVRRIFTDTMLFDVPILAMGPSGQPVVDLDSLLLRSAAGGLGLGGLNAGLAEVVTAKTFPQNTVVSFDVPNRGGQIVGLYFSIVDLPRNNGYKQPNWLLHDQLPGSWRLQPKDQMEALHPPLESSEARSQLEDVPAQRAHYLLHRAHSSGAVSPLASPRRSLLEQRLC
jgi:hypothetical protein